MAAPPCGSLRGWGLSIAPYYTLAQSKVRGAGIPGGFAPQGGATW